jgi:cytochrome c5
MEGDRPLFAIQLPEIRLPADAPAIASSIVSWTRIFVVRIANYLHGFVETAVADTKLLDSAVNDLSVRVDALEAASKPTPKPYFPTSTSAKAPSAAAATVATSSHPPSSSYGKRCNRCHALGHLQSECKSTNPEVVRKRVAKNRRAVVVTKLKPPPLPPTTHFAASATSLGDPYIMALAADATELRRRAAQSTRDKKRARLAAAASTTA